MKKILWILSLVSCGCLHTMERKDKKDKTDKNRINLSFPGKEKKSEESTKKNGSSMNSPSDSSAVRKVSSLDQLKDVYNDRKKESIESSQQRK